MSSNRLDIIYQNAIERTLLAVLPTMHESHAPPPPSLPTGSIKYWYIKSKSMFTNWACRYVWIGIGLQAMLNAILYRNYKNHIMSEKKNIPFLFTANSVFYLTISFNCVHKVDTCTLCTCVFSQCMSNLKQLHCCFPHTTSQRWLKLFFSLTYI